MTEQLKSKRQLVAPRDGFFGREREIEELLVLLSRPDISCLTIVGPGGVGKTRMAQQVANALATDPHEPFTEGIWFIPLASITDVARVPAEIAQALGLELPEEEPERALIDFLSEREALLLYDNVEQVIAVGDVIGRIAVSCPDVKQIATSRRPLRISGEQEYALLPLPLPAEDGVAEESPAVALFVQRAQMVNPLIEFDQRTLGLVVEICRKLDGLPLAIELAASRIKALSPSVLLSNLNNRLKLLTSGPRDAPARQQTLRSTIGWSYDLLTPEEQSLFRRLTVFSGGFSIDAIEDLAARSHWPSNGEDVLDVITALVDHSLIQPMADASGDPRWTMLETIREFGVELLVTLGEEEALRRAHAEVQANMVAGAEFGMNGAEQTTWIRRLTAEDGNIRAALTWTFEHKERELALRIVGPLCRYWSFRHLGHEGRSWTAQALELPGEASPVALGNALRGAGSLAEDIGEYAAAEQFHTESRAIWEQLGDLPRLSRSLGDLGNVAHDQSQFERAIAFHEEAYAVAKISGYQRGMTSAQSNLGAAAYLQGDLEGARRRWQGVVDSGTVDDPISQAMVLNNLGVACMQMGDLDEATKWLGRALAIHREIGTQSTTADVFINMSDIAMRQGNTEQSRAYFDEAIDLYRRADDPKGLHNAHYSLGCIETELGHPSEALTAFAASLRYADRANNRLGLADAFEQIASFAIETERWTDAAQLMGAARGVRAAIKAVELPAQQRLNEEMTARVRAAMAPAEYELAISDGMAIPPRQATNRALALAEEMARTAVKRSRPTLPTAIEASPYRLTKREVEVLRQLAEGKTDRDIAAALWISPRTAGTHVANILGKMEVDTRAAAVAAAFRHNLL